MKKTIAILIIVLFLLSITAIVATKEDINFGKLKEYIQGKGQFKDKTIKVNKLKDKQPKSNHTKVEIEIDDKPYTLIISDKKIEGEGLE